MSSPVQRCGVPSPTPAAGASIAASSGVGPPASSRSAGRRRSNGKTCTAIPTSGRNATGSNGPSQPAPPGPVAAQQRGHAARVAGDRELGQPGIGGERVGGQRGTSRGGEDAGGGGRPRQ